MLSGNWTLVSEGDGNPPYADVAASHASIPPLSGRIVDQARVIDDWTRSRLDTELADFEKDLGNSRRVTYDQWSNRPIVEKAWEHFLALFGAQL